MKEKSAPQDIEKFSPKKKDNAKQPPVVETVGEPLAPGMMKLLRNEITEGLNRRGNADRFAAFQHYAIAKVDSSAGSYTGSELTGNCRIRWYDADDAPFPRCARRGRAIHARVAYRGLRPEQGLAKVLAIAATKMDLAPPKSRKCSPPDSPRKALAMIKTP